MDGLALKIKEIENYVKGHNIQVVITGLLYANKSFHVFLFFLVPDLNCFIVLYLQSLTKLFSYLYHSCNIFLAQLAYFGNFTSSRLAYVVYTIYRNTLLQHWMRGRGRKSMFKRLRCCEC